MKIEKIDINLLKLARYNPRKDLQPKDIEYQKIKRSIEEFGYVDPLIVNKDLTVIGGNQRLKVLRELGFKKVDCVLLDLDKTKEKALNIALNKIEGEWDLPKLKDLLLELDTGEFDIEITGFDYTDLEELMTQFFVPDESEKDDEVPEIPKEPISKLGDLYKLGEHRLLCGDATKIEDVEKLMNGKKADMVFTDPPYGIDLDTDYTKRGAGSPLPGRKRHTAFTKVYSPVIGDNIDFNPQFILDFFNNTKEIFIWGINYFWEYLPNNKIAGLFVWNKKGVIKSPYGSGLEFCWSKQKHKRELIEITWWGAYGSDEGKAGHRRVHPTQKPIKLAEWFIKKFNKRGQNIIDLFGGSGSTLIACEKMNRKCYMMEIDPHYIDVIVKRYENYTNKKAELINRKEKTDGKRRKKVKKV